MAAADRILRRAHPMAAADRILRRAHPMAAAGRILRRAHPMAAADRILRRAHPMAAADRMEGVDPTEAGQAGITAEEYGCGCAPRENKIARDATGGLASPAS
jgi:hypothetical protein